MQDIKEIVLELMDAAVSRGLAEFELKTDDFQLKLKMDSGAAPVPVAAVPVAAVPVAATPAVAAAPAVPAASEPPAAAAAPAAAVPPKVPEGRTVEAPLVGIFYAAPAPDDPPFIEVGQSVRKGDTLFIIEAMKTMNEIPAPCDGKISHILVQSGDMVEYGQVVVVMEENK